MPLLLQADVAMGSWEEKTARCGPGQHALAAGMHRANADVHGPHPTPTPAPGPGDLLRTNGRGAPGSYAQGLLFGL